MVSDKCLVKLFYYEFWIFIIKKVCMLLECVVINSLSK